MWWGGLSPFTRISRNHKSYWSSRDKKFRYVDSNEDFEKNTLDWEDLVVFITASYNDVS